MPGRVFEASKHAATDGRAAVRSANVKKSNALDVTILLHACVFLIYIIDMLVSFKTVFQCGAYSD
jgi:hypothetical protein